MKVVHLMGALLPSGMERMFVSAAEALGDLDVETVIVGQGTDVPFAPDLRAAGYDVRIIPVIRTARGAQEWFRLIKAESPDVVHIHDEAASVISVTTSRMAAPRTPVVRTFHNIFRPVGRALVSRRVQAALTAHMVNASIAVSPAVQQNERRFGREARLILNWVDDRFWALRREREAAQRDGRIEPAMVMVGNSSAIKNQILALTALERAGVPVYFHGNEQHASVEERAALDRLSQSGALRARGTGDPGPSLVVAAGFLLPSRHEGMSIALAEALATGVPALIVRGGGSEWAETFPSVRFLEPSVDAWVPAIEALVRAANTAPPHEGPLPIDLSAKRGARELVALYDEVCRTTRRSTPR